MRQVKQPKIDIKLNLELLSRLEAIDWFSHVGEPVELALEMETVTVHSWKEAKKFYTTLKWQNTKLEAQNVVTEHLSQNYRDRYHKKWNMAVGLIKAKLELNLFPFMKNYENTHDLVNFYNSVAWDLVAILIEDHYADCDLPTRFYDDLLKVYESGHYPCGWKDGIWPEGKLVIY